MKDGKNEIFSIHIVFREVKSFIYQFFPRSDWVPLIITSLGSRVQCGGEGRIVATTSLPAVDRPNDDRWNTARLCQNLFVFVKAEWELPSCMKIFALDMTWGDFFILLLQGQPNRFLNCNCSSLQIHKVSKCRSEVSRMSNLIQMIE